MDKKPHSKSTLFISLSPSKCEHLKPLSVYSKMIAYDQKASLAYPRKFSNSFINFKFELLNSCVEKKELRHSSPDNYESPAKKSFNPKALSPDLGCFMDDCSPAERPDKASPFAISASLDKTYALRSEIKETANSQLRSEHVDCGSSSEPGGNKETEPQSFKCETVVLNLAPVFDCEIDDILCLNPVGTYSAGVFSKNEDSCKSSSMFQNKINRRKLEKREGQMDKRREDPKKKIHLNVKDEEADKGYFSMSYIKELKIGKSPSQSGYLQQSTAASSPLHRVGDIERYRDECHPECSSEQTTLSGQDDLCRIVSGAPLESVNSDSENLDGDVEEMWSIGPPMFESSMCQSVTVKLNTGSEQRRQVTEEVQSIHECQTTYSEEEATLDTSYETTSPLQVQVKSVVMIPNQKTTTSKPGAPSLSEQNAKPARPNPYKRVSQTDKYVSCGRSQRLVMFDRQEWEHRKQNYVHAVTRHMKEKPGVVQDVMSELLNLMTHVAEQTPGTSHHRQWQHPSDLTRRNYQRRFRNLKPNMSLDEWQAKSSKKHKRFAKVSKIFERSPYP